MVVNIFIGSSAVSWIISGIGVIVFTGLTSYDTWKIKAMAAQGTEGRKPAILGALTLYLDFHQPFSHAAKVHRQPALIRSYIATTTVPVGNPAVWPGRGGVNHEGTCRFMRRPDRCRRIPVHLHCGM